MPSPVWGPTAKFGWPTALHLSARGHDVVAVDSLVRRRWDEEWRHGQPDGRSPSMADRLARWQAESGTDRLAPESTSVTPPGRRADSHHQPDAIVHFAEQRSAPYSMISPRHGVETQVNKRGGHPQRAPLGARPRPRLHVMSSSGPWASTGPRTSTSRKGFIGESSTTVVTIGCSTPSSRGRSTTSPRSTTATTSTFACRIWDLRATDLNQGVVYGTTTDETALHPQLITRFDYDGIWERCSTATASRRRSGEPLTVYGKGGQTAASWTFRDTVRCIELAALNAPAAGEYRVYNQSPSSSRLLGLAEKVEHARAVHASRPSISHVPNPRREKGGAY